MRSRKRLCCSFSDTSSQYFSRMMPWLTRKTSKLGQSLRNSPVLFSSTEAHHVLNTGAVIPAPVEDDDFTSGRQLFNVALSMELRLLPFGRRGEGDHAKDARADTLYDALDHAALAGSVSSFEDDNNPGVGRLDPVLELDQLNLQLEKFGLVLFFADLLFVIDAGLLRVAVQLWHLFLLVLELFFHRSSLTCWTKLALFRGRLKAEKALDSPDNGP